MSSTTARLDRYKLSAEFTENSVTHRTIGADLHTQRRRIEILTTWVHERKLGSGAFGEVSLQREKSSGQLRAVKVIATEKLRTQELDALIDLQDRHDLFVAFLGWYGDQKTVHIAMEYVAHGDLGQYITDHSVKARSEAQVITTQILEGLVVLHGRDICHRDLKPQNILMASVSPIWVKITDFGIAKSDAGTALQTHCGTMLYQAPEMLGLLPRDMKSAGRNYTRSVDIWALGSIVHEVLTSEIPFLEIFGPMEDSTYQSIDPSEPMALGSSIDGELVVNYCAGREPFPVASLTEHGANADAINFVKSLMVANPKDRVSATDALQSAWLKDIKSSTAVDFPTPDDMEHSGEELNRPSDVDGEMALDGAQSELDVDGETALDDAHSELDVDEEMTLDSAQSQLDMGPTSLLEAVMEGDLAKVRLLLAAGMDVETTNVDGRAPLFLAARDGKTEIVRALLASGSQINTKGKVGETPLYMAAQNGHTEIVQVLVASGAQIDAARLTGETPLYIAAQNGDTEVVQVLLASGAQTEAARVSGETPLYVAAQQGHSQVVRKLLASKAQIDAARLSGETPLYTAAHKGHIEVVQVLLASGARIDAKKPSGATSLFIAAQEGHTKTVQALLASGADIEAALESGETPLYIAAQEGQTDTVQALLASKAQIEAPRATGDTPLHTAAFNGKTETVRVLLAAGANPKSENVHGKTPLYVAKLFNHKETAKVLQAARSWKPRSG